MNRYNHYFEQLVTEAQMDQSFDWVEEAEWLFAATAVLGKTATPSQARGAVHWGADVIQNAAPDLNVLVESGACTDPSGRRAAWGTNQLVDCSVDHNSVATAVSGGGLEKHLGIFALWDRGQSNQVTDGNGVPVFFEETDSFEFKVVQGAEASTGTSTPPPDQSDAIRLANIKLVYSQTQILNANIYYAIVGFFRDDYVRQQGATHGEFAYGNPADAINRIFELLESVSGGGSIVFAGTQDWHDASGVLSSTNVSGAINEIVQDLATDTGGAWGSDKIGSESFTTTGSNANLSRGSVSDQLRELATIVDGFIDEIVTKTSGNDGALVVGFYDTNETPAETTVHDKLDSLSQHRLYRDEKDRATDSYLFEQTVIAPAIDVGNLLPGQYSDYAFPEEKYLTDRHAYPWATGGATTRDLGRQIWDVCLVMVDRSDGLGPRMMPAYACDQLASGNARIKIIDPLAFDGTELIDYSVGTGKNICSICSYGNYIYALIKNDADGAADQLVKYVVNYGPTPTLSPDGGFTTVTFHTDAFHRNDGSPNSDQRWRNNCIISGPENVLVSLGNVATQDTPATYRCFNLFNSAGTLLSAGNGGHVTSGRYPTGAMACDETQNYTVVDVSGNNHYMNSHLLTDLTTAGNLSEQLINLATGIINQLIYDGESLWWTLITTSGRASADGDAFELSTIYDPNSGSTFLEINKLEVEWSDTATDFQLNRTDRPAPMTFDGLNLWVSHEINNAASAGQDAILLHRIAVSRITVRGLNDSNAADFARTDSRLTLTRNHTMPEGGGVSTEQPPQMICDGMNIYTSNWRGGEIAQMVTRIAHR